MSAGETTASPGAGRAVGRPQPDATAVPGRGALESIGKLVAFALDVLRQLPATIRLYPTEVLRHAGLFIRQNTLVVLFMVFMYGAIFGLTLHFVFTQVGIESYMGGPHALASMRGVGEVVFGWIIAAKVGCGIVAEIGAMKISEEIDAMEVMGIRSVPYLAGTRVVAAIVVVPLLWVVSLVVEWATGYLLNTVLLNSVSGGGYLYILFLFQNVRDLIFAILWATLLALIIVLVACYYGFTSHGGPVAVGRNTAQSMLVNIVIISTLAMMLVQLFYGNEPNAPIGN